MLQSGQIFSDRYRIGSLIGAGGMAEVYDATHTLTEHAVAIKVLRPSSESLTGGQANFELEAKIDARVGSPYIVRVQDAGVDELTGSPYLVMERLRGRTLARLIKIAPEGRLRVDQTLSVLRQMALGLDAAHGFGIVHRDLKPENVFVTDTGDVKILDFGIAKLLDGSNHVTQELRGTPYYMAAEQAEAEPVSAQTDIWALGLLAYRALVGHVYWRCAHAPGEGTPSLATVVREITALRRDPPSVRLAQQGVWLQLPTGFDEWFLRCLERDPRRRFESAGVAVQQLGQIFDSTTPGILPSGAETELVLGRRGGTQPTQPTRTYEEPVEVSGARAPAAMIPGGTLPGVSTERGLGERRARRLRSLAVVGGLLVVGAIGVSLRGAVGADPAQVQVSELRAHPRAETVAPEALAESAAPMPPLAPDAPASPPTASARSVDLGTQHPGSTERAPLSPGPSAPGRVRSAGSKPSVAARLVVEPRVVLDESEPPSPALDEPRDIYGIAPLQLALRRRSAPIAEAQVDSGMPTLPDGAPASGGQPSTRSEPLETRPGSGGKPSVRP